jgi:FkbM family methyltransferase
MNAPDDARELAAIARTSYAQNQEDILLDRLFPGHVGTYMDIGANNPVVDNNTYFFYLRGWRGVTIEPIRRLCDLHRLHRPDDLNLAVAVSDVEGFSPFFEVRDGDPLSTLSEEVAEQHRGRGLNVVEHRVPVRTVAGLVREHGIEPPDIVCIDVECCEDRVIRGIPLDSWRPAVLVVEGTIPMTETPNYQGWEPRLFDAGYLFAADNGVNRFYLRDDLADRAERLRRPVNVLDDYRRFEAVYLESQVEDLRRQVRELTLQGEDARRERDSERAAWRQERSVHVRLLAEFLDRTTLTPC